ncbi:sigma 54-interacting transcriptional regulator [Desulfobulbus alkaliphilus]|uniref:sigma 54-interacting transcriptional regulator n=1 Tax=Desulfobulbus alkaliphilus TaxID=869814 RepID=UPI0019623F02|nr:sigma 54-interacting transcriptional regulator [Desulfobulbus alkaliphilus]MBM9537453.1 sigma 54-interacting transcriptional regulator [Desulfobulbus alkaliphilus]
MKQPTSKQIPTDLEGIAFLLFDGSDRIKAVGGHIETLTGQVPEKLFGKSAQELFTRKGSVPPLAELSTLRDLEKLQQHLIIDLEQNGQLLRIPVTLQGLRDQEGATAGTLLAIGSGKQCLLNQVLLDSLSIGVLTVNCALEIISFNHAAEQITGWTRSEVLGKNCQEIFPPELCENNCQIKLSIEQAQHIPPQNVFMAHRDGSAVTLSLTSSPLYDFNGKVIGGVQSFHDCSDALSNELILASVADGVFTIDHNRIITSFNPAAERITGWKKEEVIGKPCNEIFHSSVCGDNCLLQKAIACKAPFIDRAIFIKNKVGISIPVTVSSAPLFDDFGHIVGGIETFRDNTLSVRETMILDSIADGVFTVDRNWNITSFNKAAEDITGWSREDAMGMSCADIFHSSICGKNCAIAESLYTGTPVASRSITIRNNRGEKIPISISAAPLTDHEGNIIGGVETFRDLTAINTLRQQLNQKYTFDDAIISKSTAMQRLFAILPDIARSPSTVLILGESGTGKELIARALYNSGERREKPFIIVNCAALPETLLESELFGYKAGAFTDARKDKIGRFAAAEGGTLFLDEIGDLPGNVQVKLLRVLQEKVYEPLGSNTPVKADVRIITATNRDLPTLVREGLFREDLFYRLNVVKISLPPLRERKEDIPLLVEHFIKKYSAQQGKDIVGISSGALATLMRYEYPGNIRELENIVEYSFILCDGGYIQPNHLPEPFATEIIEQKQTATDSSKPQTLEEIEKEAIKISLERNRWKKMITCRELGISKDTLRRKIERYEIANPLDNLPEDTDLNP